jgi:hypothetical protein
MKPRLEMPSLETLFADWGWLKDSFSSLISLWKRPS